MFNVVKSLIPLISFPILIKKLVYLKKINNPKFSNNEIIK